jgi:hypothetical protein
MAADCGISLFRSQQKLLLIPAVESLIKSRRMTEGGRDWFTGAQLAFAMLRF